MNGGLSPNLEDDSNSRDSAIHWACSFNNLEVAQLLLTRGVSANTTNKDGQTPLHLSCKNRNKLVSELLLSNRADINLEDSLNKTPLDYIPENFSQLKEELLAFAASLSSNADSSHIQQKVEPEHTSNIKLEISTDQPLNGQEEDNHTASSAIDSSQLLLLWPPVQRQRLFAGHVLKLSNTRILFLCIGDSEVEAFPLLTWSGFMDVLDRVGLQVQVKRSPQDASIILAIDPDTCPGRQRYDISVTVEHIHVAASDLTALHYALHTLGQIIQLHSAIQSPSPVDGVVVVSVPCMQLSDWPDVANRAVVWTYRGHARTSSQVLRRSIEVLARLRVNQLVLLIDKTAHSTAYRIEDRASDIDTDTDRDLNEV